MSGNRSNSGELTHIAELRAALQQPAGRYFDTWTDGANHERVDGSPYLLINRTTVASTVAEIDRLRAQNKTAADERDKRYAKSERAWGRILSLFRYAIETATKAHNQGICSICGQELKFTPRRQIAQVSQLEGALFMLQEQVGTQGNRD